MVEVNWKLIIMREKIFKRMLKDDASITYGGDNRKLIVESNVFALTIILF